MRGLRGEQADKQTEREKHTHTDRQRSFGPFFSVLAGGVGSGMGSKTLQSFPVWSLSLHLVTACLRENEKQTD